MVSSKIASAALLLSIFVGANAFLCLEDGKPNGQECSPFNNDNRCYFAIHADGTKVQKCVEADDEKQPYTSECVMTKDEQGKELCEYYCMKDKCNTADACKKWIPADKFNEHMMHGNVARVSCPSSGGAPGGAPGAPGGAPGGGGAPPGGAPGAPQAPAPSPSATTTSGVRFNAPTGISLAILISAYLF